MSDSPIDLPPASSAEAADEAALDWFVRRSAGLDAADEAAFQRWLAADPAHATAFARWEEDWSALDSLPAAAVQALRDALPEAAPATGEGAASHPRTQLASKQQASPRRAWFASLGGLMPRAAMSALAITGVSAALLTWQHQQPQFEQQYLSMRGEQRSIALPDGSQLHLDTATQAAISFYPGRREVHLTGGQAMFEVSANPERPFDVIAGPVRVTVVGTRFSVRYTPEVAGADGVRVAVEEGHVRVRQRSALPDLLAGLFGQSAVDLVAGQQLLAGTDGTPGPVAAVAPTGIAPWRDSRVSFNDTPLEQALAEFARYGDTRLTVQDPAVAALRLTGTFDPKRLDNFIRVLPQVLPVRMRQGTEGTEIVSAAAVEAVKGRPAPH